MNGSWFIRSLCKAFMEKACDYDIHELMALTQTYLGEIKDPAFSDDKHSLAYETISLEKKLYFNPGFSMKTFEA